MVLYLLCKFFEETEVCILSKKIIAAVLAACMFCTVANATEVTDTDGENDSGTALVDMADGLDGSPADGGASLAETGSGDNGGSDGAGIESEPSEPVSQPSESVSSGGSTINMISIDGATVNVSDQSVQAIADAVVESSGQSFQYKYQYVIEYTDGRYIILDTNVSSLVEDNVLLICGATSSWSSIRLIVNPSDYYLQSSLQKITVYCNANSRTLTFTRGFDHVISFGTLSELGETAKSSYSTYITGDTGILWCNEHIQLPNPSTYETVLVYESPYLPSVVHDVSFSTGFDDYEITGQTSDNFVLPDAQYDGYHFDGWYLDADYTLPYAAGYKFTSDTMLYAKWIPYRTITFLTGIDGYEVDSIQVLDGTAYTPPDFAYSGYEYIGAYTDSAYEHLFVGGTQITEDTTFYLRFEEIVYDMGALLTQQVELSKGLQVIQSQLWIILVVGLLYYVYRFFRIFF